MLLAGAVKLVGQVVIGYGVSAFTSAIVKSITPENAVKMTKVAIKIGGLCVGGVVAAAASKRFNKNVDDVVDIANKVKTKLDELKKEESKEKEAE